MPTYEYQCQACGHQMEAVQRITEDALKECPACNKPTLERLISSGNFLLKGSGWYKDGYGSSAGKKRTENDRIDKLTKAIDEDKKKTSEAAAGAADASSGGESSGSTSSSGSDSSAGSSTPSTSSTTSS